MKWLNKLIGKKNHSRISSQTVVEETVLCAIPFRTRYGGVRPCGYRETPKMAALKEEAINVLENLIESGVTDIYSDPEMFSRYIRSVFKQIENEISRQDVENQHVIVSIQEVAKAALVQEERRAEETEAMIQMLRENEVEKGKGDHYEMEEK